MVSTYGTTVKMLLNTVHHGLIIWKVSINDKDDYKTPPTWSYLSVITLLLENSLTYYQELIPPLLLAL